MPRKSGKFTIYLNSRYIGECPATLKDAKRWIKTNLQSTHMGQWIKKSYPVGNDYEYATTVGAYYYFCRTTN